MFDSRGLPDYPPPHNAWQFPPPPISPRWKWAAIAAMIFSLIGGTTMLVVAIAIGSSGIPSAIDDTRLISVIERECRTMTSRVESLPVVGSPRDQALAITDQNRAVQSMVSAIRAEGPDVIDSDPPTADWLADWDQLVAARAAFAAVILDGSTPNLDIPEDDRGKDIYLRMDDVWLGKSSCDVPVALLNPYPDNESEI